MSTRSRQIRRAAGWSLAKVAVMAEVSSGTARIYEIDPSEVAPSKRRQLDAIYRGLAMCVAPRS